MRPAFIEKLIGKMDRLDAKSVTSIVTRLAEEKGFLETVFNALKEGVLVLGADHKALYFNRAARDLLGLGSDFSMGDSLHRHLPEPFWKALEEDRRIRKPGAAVHQGIEIFYPQNRFLQIYVSMLYEDSSSETDSSADRAGRDGGASKSRPQRQIRADGRCHHAGGRSGA